MNFCFKISILCTALLHVYWVNHSALPLIHQRSYNCVHGCVTNTRLQTYFNTAQQQTTGIKQISLGIPTRYTTPVVIWNSRTAKGISIWSNQRPDGLYSSALSFCTVASSVLLIDWLSRSLTSREHTSGYMRLPCKGHGEDCSWLFFPKPITQLSGLIDWLSMA